MPRIFTPLEAHENQVFLEVLGETGNARLAAREAGRAHSSFYERARRNAEFAQRWEGAAAAAHARFHLAGGKRGPEAAGASGPGKGRGGGSRAGRRGDGPVPGERSGLRTRGGEPVVVRTRSGRLQIRLAHPGRLTKAAEQVFLYALSATANVRLSAAAAGASPRAFYRRRLQDPAFAREMRLALRMGYERLEAAALQEARPESRSHDRWRTCSSAAPIPELSFDQIFQVLCLHEKSVRQSWDRPHRRRRRGESDSVYRERLRAMWTVEKNSEAEEAARLRADRWETTGDWRLADEPPPPPLPPLDLVTGWSRADPAKRRHNPGLALFGGWRIGEMESKLRLGRGACAS
jgi:hypothetical protein